MSLQDDLERAKARVVANDEDINSLNCNRLDNKAEVDKIKAQIEAEKKPKLRHGDYGLYTCMGDKYRFYVDQCGTLRFVERQDGWCTNATQPLHESAKVVVLGNIFDDLKAMQEDVTEFTAERNEDGLLIKSTGKGVSITVSEDAGWDSCTVCISRSQFDKLVTGVRQIQSTRRKNER